MHSYNFDRIEEKPRQLRMFTGTDPYEVPNFTTVDYLGSKRALLHHILPAIKCVADEGAVILDLFAGSGAVAFALQPYYVVYANDIQHYSFEMCQALLSPLPTLSAERLSSLIVPNFKKNLLALYEIWGDAVTKENEFFLTNPSDQLVSEYRQWCDNTPFWGYINGQTPSEFSVAEQLLIGPTKEQYRSSPKKYPYALFAMYFMNAYFGVQQTIEIDSLRFAIDQLDDPVLRSILLTALMSAMSASVSSTTHFAQFLNIRHFTSFTNVTSKRKLSLWDLFVDRLRNFVYLQQSLASGDLKFRYQEDNRCLCKDYKEVFTIPEIQQVACVYADPPYFKEHYSRYYHVLETLVLYDYPELTFNPRTSRITEGRYRQDRYVSPFSKKSTAPAAIESIAEHSSRIGASLVLSYSNTSLVPLDELIARARHHYREIEVEEIPHQHSNQGRQDVTEVNEYLVICKR